MPLPEAANSISAWDAESVAEVISVPTSVPSGRLPESPWMLTL